MQVHTRRSLLQPFDFEYAWLRGGGQGARERERERVRERERERKRGRVEPPVADRTSQTVQGSEHWVLEPVEEEERARETDRQAGRQTD